MSQNRASVLRQINVEGMETFPVTPQPAPQLLWLSVDDLVIDDRYQRPLNPNNWAAIKRIAKEFRWSRFSPILVAPVEGGRYALIDGQHRAHAAALCRIESIPAMVALVAPEEQALAFIEINTRQIRVSGHVVYRAALAAGEEWAIACRDVVAAAGCELMARNSVSKNDKRAGQVFAIGLIRGLVAAGHGHAVTEGLAALMDYDRDAVANFTDTLLTPWLSACAEISGGRQAYLDALHARRPWLVIEAADRWADQEHKPKATTRREYFAMLLRREGGVA